MLVFFDFSIPVIIVTLFFGVILVFHLYVLWKQPESSKPVAFKVCYFYAEHSTVHE